MKYLQLFIFLVFVNPSFAQKNIAGIYRNHFGHSFRLHENFTFDYFINTDTTISWTYGTWTLQKDTILMKPVLILDKYSIDFRDSMAMELQKCPNPANSLQMVGNKTSGFQDNASIPVKLFHKKNMLFQLDKTNELIKEKIFVARINGYVNPQFYKSPFDEWILP